MASILTSDDQVGVVAGTRGKMGANEDRPVNAWSAECARVPALGQMRVSVSLAGQRGFIRQQVKIPLSNDHITVD